jgi:hypothetical protein
LIIKRVLRIDLGEGDYSLKTVSSFEFRVSGFRFQVAGVGCRCRVFRFESVTFSPEGGLAPALKDHFPYIIFHISFFIGGSLIDALLTELVQQSF